MLTTALLMMLAAEPAFLSNDTPRAVQLVSAGVPLPSYRGWTAAQLRMEYVRLEDLRPGLALPLLSLLTGFTGMAVSLFAYAIALGNFRGADLTANIAFGVGGTVSVALTAIGIIKLATGSSDRKIYGAQMEAVERLADGYERDERLLDLWEQRHGPGALPPIIGPPPKGPPPPTSAPPVVPGPPIIPGQVSLVVPLLYAHF